MFALRLRVDVHPRQPSFSQQSPAKPTSFLLVVKEPEEVTLGGLAGMIQVKWRKLHPELEPLAIKKLLDGDNEDVNLDTDLTVADVWVDRGKHSADRKDQRGTVLVIQRPAPYTPERFPSVALDWAAAAQDFERRRDIKAKKEAIEKPLSTIEEDEEAQSHRASTISLSSSHHYPGDEVRSSVERRPRDLPLSSVERPQDVVVAPLPKRKENLSEPMIPSTPSLERKENRSEPMVPSTPVRSSKSVELGESPSVGERPQSRKRKPSRQETMPVKQPRLGEPHVESMPESPKATTSTLLPATPSPERKRGRAPSFSSPDRRPSDSEPAKGAPKQNGLGLGITKSPTRRSAMLNLTQDTFPNGDLPSTQSSIPRDLSRPAKQGTTEKHKPLQSVLHQESSKKSHKRRSVSFADEDDLGPNGNPPTRSTPRDIASKLSQKTPTPASTETARDPPMFSSMVFPPEFTDDRILQITREAEQEEQERKDLERKLKLPNADPEYLKIVKEMRGVWRVIQKGTRAKSISIQDLRNKLPPLRLQLQEFEKKMDPSSLTAKPVAQSLSSSPTLQSQPVSEKSRRDDVSKTKQAHSRQKTTSKRSKTPPKLSTQEKTPETTPATEPGSSKKSTRNDASKAKQALSTQKKTTPKPPAQRKTSPKPPTQGKSLETAPATEPTLPPSTTRVARSIITDSTIQNSRPADITQSPSWSFNHTQSPRRDSNTSSAKSLLADPMPKPQEDVSILSSSKDEESDNPRMDSGSNPASNESPSAPAKANSAGPKPQDDDDVSMISASEDKESDASEIDSGSKTTPKKSPPAKTNSPSHIPILQDDDDDGDDEFIPPNEDEESSDSEIDSGSKPRRQNSASTPAKTNSVGPNPKPQDDKEEGFVPSPGEDESEDSKIVPKKSPTSAPSKTNSIGPKPTPQTDDEESEPGSSEDEEGDDSESDGSKSDSESDPGSKSAPKKSPTSAPTKANSARPFSSPLHSAQLAIAPSSISPPPPASQPTRITLKGLLAQKQKEAQARQASRRPAPRPSVFDGPNSSEPEGDSDPQGGGDVMHSGKMAPPRKLWCPQS